MFSPRLGRVILFIWCLSRLDSLWLGSLVRYDPHSVAALQNSRDWILIEVVRVGFLSNRDGFSYLKPLGSSLLKSWNHVGVDVQSDAARRVEAKALEVYCHSKRRSNAKVHQQEMCHTKSSMSDPDGGRGQQSIIYQLLMYLRKHDGSTEANSWLVLQGTLLSPSDVPAPREST